MKYENAGDILPAELLKELQKYAAGKLLYIPSGEEKRAWGETSGYRGTLQKRNRMIRNKYGHGVTVSELADEYFLSLDSIKKIIYSKKNDGHITYAPTLESAVQYTNVGMLEEWIHCYLLLTQKVALSLDDIMKEERLYYGVVKFPLRLIQEEGSVRGGEDQTIDDIAAHPPLLIRYEAGKFYCLTSNELLAILKQRKVNAHPAIIVLSGNADYKRFMKHYGTVLIFCK
ncbi:CD3324 family protein [Paenibacillus sp. GCM10012306]|uniref:CD3324 family protein n=1 Tax=Paenibacillus sp. GCM10012306 TaxID=3317342 RepID=UPI003623603A